MKIVQAAQGLLAYAEANAASLVVIESVVVAGALFGPSNVEFRLWCEDGEAAFAAAAFDKGARWHNIPGDYVQQTLLILRWVPRQPVAPGHYKIESRHVLKLTPLQAVAVTP